MNPAQSSVDWSTFRAEHVSSYVDDCPFHLFDTKRERNVTHAELRADILAGLHAWIRMPLACSDVVDAICEASCFDADGLCEGTTEYRQNVEACVFSAMTKTPCGDCARCFLAALQKELWQQHNHACDTLYVTTVLHAVHQLIARKSAQEAIPVHRVRAQIELLGQYAILSHRWERPGDELCFADAAHLCDPRVQAKRGFRKMKAFRGVVGSLYGCRYLWLDSVCISEPDRNASIPRMFGWYHRAYVCVIYLPIGQIQPKGFQWTNRGWTLQEYLAARRIKIIGAGLPTKKFDAIRRGTVNNTRIFKDSTLLGPLGTLEPYWNDYRPGTDKALSIFGAMRNCKTTRPEDKAYCLFSALQIDIPVNYGEGFDMAFYRLQVACLTRTGDLRLLLWEGAPSPHNSALAGDFAAFKHAYWYEKRRAYAGSPAVSFDSEGVLRMLVSLHPWRISPSKTYMFALLGEVRYGYRRKCFGILLRRRADQVYRRIQYIECEESDISVYKEPEWVYIK